jgi:hypothetical protein
MGQSQASNPLEQVFAEQFAQRARTDPSVALAILNELSQYENVMRALGRYLETPGSDALLEAFGAEVARAMEEDPALLWRLVRAIMPTADEKQGSRRRPRKTAS